MERSWISRLDRLGGRLPARLAAQEVEEHADQDDHGQRHDLRELVLQPLVGEAERGQVVVRVPAGTEPVDAEARPDQRDRRQQRPERRHDRADPRAAMPPGTR
jgi:hypothetical protein